MRMRKRRFARCAKIGRTTDELMRDCGEPKAEIREPAPERPVSIGSEYALRESTRNHVGTGCGFSGRQDTNKTGETEGHLDRHQPPQASGQNHTGGWPTADSGAVGGATRRRAA